MKKFSDLDLLQHAKNLFPICRSLTGEGVRATLDYFESYNNNFKRLRYKSGENFFDWEIPLEWNIKDAYIQNIKSGKKYAEFKKSNLHIMGYSEPINEQMKLETLKKYIYTEPNQPDLIPYITSYYERNWGFCLSENQKNKLPEGVYKVFIDSSLEKGFLELSHAILKGKKQKEVFFSSYICHPSLANNELSGPVLINAILDYVKIKYPNPNFSYRFVLLPETIGAITYISNFGQELKNNVIAGINLSCVGDERAYSHVKSPYGNTLADNALSSALINLPNVKEYSFLERGSDERQYCAPGIRLPLCTFCRSKFGEYPEYHTSADNFNVVTESGLQGSLQVIKTIIDAFETCLYPLATVIGEPQLGKRGLYPNISRKLNKGEKHPAKIRKDFLQYSDGSNSIFEISKKINVPLSYCVDEAKILLINNLICDQENDE